jgi:hypothetical protein
MGTPYLPASLRYGLLLTCVLSASSAWAANPAALITACTRATIYICTK